MSLQKISFGIGFFLLGVLPVTLAADTPNPVGFPKKGDPGGGVGAIRIWYEDGVWHLRTSTENTVGKKDKLMVFTGSVRCNDKMTVEGKDLEKGRTIVSDILIVHQDGKGFDFQFRTYGATDQADFKLTTKAKTLTFKLFIDGEKAAANRIIIGADGEHPAKNEFTLPAQPKK